METILVVDDDDSVRGIVAEVLTDDGFNVLCAASGEEALALFKSSEVALVFTDIRMPGMDGITLLAKLKTIRPQVDVIIMTSHASLDSSVKAVKHGAYDYVFKPFESLEDLSALASRAIEHYRLTVERDLLVATLTRNNEELERINYFFKELAVKDGLTGLYNHRHLNEHLLAERDKAILDQKELAVVFVDVDHFKRFNDTEGHLNGDEVLRALGGLLQDKSRDQFIVGRWGGEEFVVLAPNTSLDEAGQFAEDLRQTIEDFEFRASDQRRLGKITVSAGVAALSGTESPDDLVARADSALYEAKRAGRNNVKVACLR